MLTNIEQQTTNNAKQYGALIAVLMTATVSGLIINSRRNKQHVQNTMNHFNKTKNSSDDIREGADKNVEDAADDIENNRCANNDSVVSSRTDKTASDNDLYTRLWAYLTTCGLLVILTVLVLLFWSSYQNLSLSNDVIDGDFEPVSYSVPTGIRFAKIQDIQVGERAIGKNPEVTDSERSTFLPDPEPATWRKLTLEMIKSDGKRLDITLLRPLSWIKESNAQISATIFLNLPEMGAQGLAKVLNIEPCPPIKKGRGNVITGTFHHEAANTIDLYVEGLSKPIGCTDNHPFWSVTRQEFVEAGKLLRGEALQLHSGQTTKVVQILPRPGPERVNNLEVMNEHVYRVTWEGVLVHNTCNRFHATADAKGRITQVNATVTKSNVGTGQGTNQSTRNYANSLNDLDGKIDAGHIIARILGGGVGHDNIVPLSPTTNRGVMANLEMRIANAVRTTGKRANISVELYYEGNSTRPSHIRYKATVGTESFDETFYN